MKPYPVDSEMRMAHDAQLGTLLRNTIRQHHIQHVVETGTHWGEGSTRFVWSCFPAPPQSFVTIEADWASVQRARVNLADTSVVVWYGTSMPRDDALEFLATDMPLQTPDAYPDIYSDGVQHPIQVYGAEVQGRLFSTPPTAYSVEENLLRRALQPVRQAHPLVVLDSSGGIGWLEFNTTWGYLHDVPFTVLLDDVKHVKHFRSLAAMHEHPAWDVLGVGASAHAWALGTYTPLP